MNSYKTIAVASTVALLGIARAAAAQPDPPAPPAEPKDERSKEKEPPASASSYDGYVLDPLGQPVVGAQVMVPSLGLEAEADEEGRFRIELPPGQHEVRVEAPGFAPLRTSLVFDEATAATGVELMVEYEVGEIVVTGTKTETLVQEAPVKTQVVGRAQIERRKATNLAEALDATTGVRVESNCQNCGFTQVRLNGLDGRYSQILIDGRPVFSTLAGVYALEQIPQEMIERVEIVKGGGSALYGGSAIAGVINVLTKRPADNFANVTLRGGLLGGGDGGEYRLSASAGVVNQSRTFAMHMFGGGFSREPWDANGDGFSEVGRARQVAAGAEAYYDPFPDAEIQLKFHVLREQRRGGDAFDKVEHDAAIAESIHTHRTGGELRFSHLANQHVRYEAGYGFAYTERNSYYGAGGDVVVPTPPGSLSDLTPEEYQQLIDALAAKQAALGAYGKTTNPVHNADTFSHFSFEALGTMIVSAGMQLQSDGVKDSAPAYDRVIDETYWNVAGVLQHDWLFADWGESIVGVRVDKHSELADLVASPRGALLFKPLDWLRLRTSVSTGFRAPQVFDEDLHITIVGGEGQVIRNTPDLEPERSMGLAQQIELHADPGPWHLQGGLNGFFSRISDAFVLDETDDPETTHEVEFSRVNRGVTTVGGGELEAKVRYQQVWGAGAGWAYEVAANEEPDPDFGEKELFRTPRTYGFVETWTEPVAGLQLQTSLQLTGPMKVPHYAGTIAVDRLERSDWFFDWGANLGYRIDLGKDVYAQPFIGVRNILNSFQDDFDWGPNRDAGYVYGPRLPRTFYGGLKAGI